VECLRDNAFDWRCVNRLLGNPGSAALHPGYASLSSPYCFGDKLREMGDKPADGLSRPASVHEDAAITTPAEMEGDDVASEAEEFCTKTCRADPFLATFGAARNIEKLLHDTDQLGRM